MEMKEIPSRHSVSSISSKPPCPSTPPPSHLLDPEAQRSDTLKPSRTQPTTPTPPKFFFHYVIVLMITVVLSIGPRLYAEHESWGSIAVWTVSWIMMGCLVLADLLSDHPYWSNDE
jgi:hypothetical protein